MTVADAARKITFPGAGLTGPYSFNFRILLANDNITPFITVTKINTNVTPNTRVTLAYPGDYSFVPSNAGLNGGTITTVATINSGYILLVEGTTPLTQAIKYSNEGDFAPEKHEVSYDKLTMIVQESREAVDSALRLNPESTATPPTFEDPVDGAVPIFDAVSNQYNNGPSAGDIASAQTYAAAALASQTAAAISETNAAASAAAINYRFCGTAGGTANALTLTPGSALASYTGALLEFIINTPNTTEAMTANASTLGVKSIKTNFKGSKVNPAIGMFQAGMHVIAQYDGTDLVVLNTPWDNQATDIAAAATVALATATGNFANLTGTGGPVTAISGLTKGRRFMFRHTGIHQFTHSSSLFLLNNAANITTAAGDFSEWVSDGTNVYMTGYARADGKSLNFPPTASAMSGFLPSSIAGTSTTASLSVSTGQCADSTNAVLISKASITGWNVTNGANINGYDGGTTLPNSSTIHFFICTGSGGTGVYASTSLTPTFPTNFNTAGRRIFSLNTNGSGALIPVQNVQEVYGGAIINWLTTQTFDVNVANLGTSRTLYTLNVPTGIKVQPLHRFCGANVAGIILTSPDETDVAPTISGGQFTSVPGSDWMETAGFSSPAGGGQILTTNTSGQIGARATTTSVIFNLVTRGWIDFRR